MRSTGPLSTTRQLNFFAIAFTFFSFGPALNNALNSAWCGVTAQFACSQDVFASRSAVASRTNFLPLCERRFLMSLLFEALDSRPGPMSTQPAFFSYFKADLRGNTMHSS